MRKVLLLTKKFPYPAKDGETIAIMQIIKGLAAKGIEVTALCMNTRKHFSDISQMPSGIRQLADFHAVDVNTDPTPFGVFCNLFSSASYHYARFYSKKFEQHLVALLHQKTFNIVQAEGLYLLLYLNIIRKYSTSAVILRAHNIEHEIWERTIAQMPPGIKRAYLQLQTKRLKQFEKSVITQADAIVAISESDKNKLDLIAPSIPKMALPVGMDITGQMPKVCPEPLSVVHLGGMDWLPNQQGVQWFLDHCWGNILQHFPKATFYLAGRNIPDRFRRMHIPNFVVDGEVEDARQYLLSKSVVIVPLLSGSGIRVKIIENMALGKCIVSTSTGAEGIGAEHGRHILIADSPADFTRAVCELLRNESLRQQIGENAFNFARQRFDNTVLTQKLISFYQNISG
jgi:glycosyltransferase involved in cell wall biosynthesis